jgi:hypothetical protein
MRGLRLLGCASLGFTHLGAPLLNSSQLQLPSQNNQPLAGPCPVPSQSSDARSSVPAFENGYSRQGATGVSVPYVWTVAGSGRLGMEHSGVSIIMPGPLSGIFLPNRPVLSAPLSSCHE